jgi:hypothetical protein
MTEDEIMSLWNEHADGMNGDTLMRFANAVASKEREACAKVADGWPDYDVQGLAEAIRARGQA